MLISLREYRRQLRSTFDAVIRAEATLENQRERRRDASEQGTVLDANGRYRRARERQRARRAARRFSP
jgi:hypothetical protein